MRQDEPRILFSSSSLTWGLIGKVAFILFFDLVQDYHSSCSPVLSLVLVVRPVVICYFI